jgi:hypothetical protein
LLNNAGPPPNEGVADGEDIAAIRIMLYMPNLRC